MSQKIALIHRVAAPTVQGVLANLERAEACCEIIRRTGNIPVAPFIDFIRRGYFDDSDIDQRSLGMKANIYVISKAVCRSALVFCPYLEDETIGMIGDIRSLSPDMPILRAGTFTEIQTAIHSWENC